MSRLDRPETLPPDPPGFGRLRRAAALLLTAWLGLLLPGSTLAVDGAPPALLETVVEGAGRVVAIANAGDGRLFVVDANGRILAYEVTDAGLFNFLGTFLDIQGRVFCCQERGLLGLAFHPDYATNRYFYVYYTSEPFGDVVIARYHAPTNDTEPVDPAESIVDADTETILLTIAHRDHGNHNGGGLAFGPDGYLYAAVGDGGGAGDPLQSGQNLGTHLGKILRLDVNLPAPYIPPSNPFVGATGLDEIWAWGLRNPWRITFDRLTGDLFIADVGQDNREEINLQPAGSGGGENYGWRRMEGSACHNPSSGCQTGSLVRPILEYGHGEGCSVTGGYRYRGSRIPSLYAAYLFGDFCSKKIWVGTQGAGGSWSRQQLLTTNLSISTFGEDAEGELYVAHIGGSVHRIAPVAPRLTVTRVGAGTGTVSGPGDLDCGTECSAAYEPGEIVTLTASVPASSWFAGWSGACGGTGDCVVTMDGDRTVTATFNLRPALQFSASTYSVSEGTGTATITVKRLTSTAGTVTVDYAIAAGSATAPPAAGADFAGPDGLLTGTLTFAPGQTSRTFQIPIVDDALAEGPETVMLSLHDPTGGAVLGAQSTAVLTIVSNDAAGGFKFSKSAYSASESSPNAALTVRRSGGRASASVVWSVDPTGTTAVAGVDYVYPADLQARTLVFGANVTSQDLPVVLLTQGDTMPNVPPRTIKFALSNPQPSGFAGSASVTTPATTVLTLTDDDVGVRLGQAAYTVSEGRGSVSIPVVRTGPTNQPFTVNFATGGGSASATASPTTCSAGADYRPIAGSLTFNSGQTSKTIKVRLCGDAVVEGDETFSLSLTDPTAPAQLAGPSTATVTIQDND